MSADAAVGLASIEMAVRASRKLEGLLERRFSATGKGLHEKVSSVERALPKDAVKTLRWIATVRNRLVHEDGYELSDAAQFEAAVARAVRALDRGATRQQRRGARRAVRGAGAARRRATRVAEKRESFARLALGVSVTLALLGLVAGVVRAFSSLEAAVARGAHHDAMSQAQLLAEEAPAALRAASGGLGMALLMSMVAFVIARRARS